MAVLPIGGGAMATDEDEGRKMNNERERERKRERERDDAGISAYQSRTTMVNGRYGDIG